VRENGSIPTRAVDLNKRRGLKEDAAVQDFHSQRGSAVPRKASGLAARKNIGGAT
jgi:hypothetical protein